MSDPVLALILIAVFSAAMAAAHWFKTLDSGLGHAAQTPLLVGVVAGILLRFAGGGRWHIVAIGVVLTIAALYVRLTGRESEPVDGMILGALMGAAAALPLAIRGEDELRMFSECVLAGAVAGFGVTFALTHVADKLRQFVFDAITAAVAIGAAALPDILGKAGLRERDVAFSAAALIPLIVIGTAFKQAPGIRKELRDEASLGFIDDEDIRPTAHPLLRLGRAGWHDAAAHREFVRIANLIALRKQQQRTRSEEAARLYQLEVIKLRERLLEMTRIDRAMRNATAASSSTIRPE